METFPRFSSIIDDIRYMEVFHFTAGMAATFSKVKSFFEFALASSLFVCAWIQGYGCC